MANAPTDVGAASGSVAAANLGAAGGSHDTEPMSVDDFIASFKKPLTQPILSAPRLRTTKDIHIDNWLPRRSARLAAKSKYREAKPEAQARKMLMRKLGFEAETEHPNEASFDEFQAELRSPLTLSKRRAMQVL